MSPLMVGVLYLFKLLLTFYFYVLTLRLWLQKFRANAFNPVSRFVIQISDPVVKPIRYVMPGFKGFDGAIVFLMLFVQWLLFSVLYWALAGAFPPVLASILMALFKVILLNINFFMLIIVAGAIISWFPQLQRSAAASIIHLLSSPILLITRRWVPLLGGLDFSPVVVLVVFHLIKIVVLFPMMGTLIGVVR